MLANRPPRSLLVSSVVRLHTTAPRPTARMISWSILSVFRHLLVDLPRALMIKLDGKDGLLRSSRNFLFTLWVVFDRNILRPHGRSPQRPYQRCLQIIATSIDMTYEPGHDSEVQISFWHKCIHNELKRSSTKLSLSPSSVNHIRVLGTTPATQPMGNHTVLSSRCIQSELQIALQSVGKLISTGTNSPHPQKSSKTSACSLKSNLSV